MYWFLRLRVGRIMNKSINMFCIVVIAMFVSLVFVPPSVSYGKIQDGTDGSEICVQNNFTFGECSTPILNQCCAGVADLVWDYDNSAEVISETGSIVSVKGSAQSIKWTVSGSGFYFDADHTLTEINGGTSITLYRSAGACGAATIIAYDGCSEVSEFVRSPNGRWRTLTSEEMFALGSSNHEPEYVIHVDWYMHDKCADSQQYLLGATIGKYKYEQLFFYNLAGAVDTNTPFDCTGEDFSAERLRAKLAASDNDPTMLYANNEWHPFNLLDGSAAISAGLVEPPAFYYKPPYQDDSTWQIHKATGTWEYINGPYLYGGCSSYVAGFTYYYPVGYTHCGQRASFEVLEWVCQ